MHQIFPQLDGMTVDAATSILGQLAAVVQRGKMAAGAARRQGTFLLAALRVLVWPAPITRIAALIAVAWGSFSNPESALPSRN